MLIALLVLHLADARAAPTPEDPWDADLWGLVRVEDPDHPDAIARSATGSVLLSPPATGAWRVEEPPAVDVLPAWRLSSDLAPPPAEAEAGGETSGFQGVGPWRAWDAAAAMQVQPWHEVGLDGSRGGDPVKVAIFDVQWAGLSAAAAELGDVQTHDCWVHPGCEVPIDDQGPTFAWETGSHGVACAEAVRDLAPGVELHLVRINGLTTLENAVDWAVREGVEVVSMSMSFFNNSFYDGTGPVAELVERLSAGGVLLVNSAGNYAEEHWRGPFRDDDGDGVHEFFDDRRTLPVYLYPGVNRVQMNWDDYDSCGRTDLDAWMWSADGRVVGRAEARQDPDAGGCAPVERLRAWADEEGWHYLEVRLHAGVPDVELDVLPRDIDAWEGIAAGSVTDPGSHPSALTVGAVRAQGYATNDPEPFSSRGPTNGGLAKPDLAGPDGITTSIYGPSGFYGTSAAAPSVAAAIALVMSAEPGLDARGAADRLMGSALSDLATWQGADPGLGAGKVRLPPPDAASVGACSAAGTAPGTTPMVAPSLAAMGWLGLRLLRRARRRRASGAGRLSLPCVQPPRAP